MMGRCAQAPARQLSPGLHAEPRAGLYGELIARVLGPWHAWILVGARGLNTLPILFRGSLLLLQFGKPKARF